MTLFYNLVALSLKLESLCSSTVAHQEALVNAFQKRLGFPFSDHNNHSRYRNNMFF